MIYSSLLFDEYNNPSFAQLYQKVLDLNRYIKELGYSTSAPISMKKIRVNRCKACDPNDIIVGADGMLYACEHCADTNSFGNVMEGVTDQSAYQEWKKPTKRQECCQDCVFLPLCTDFPYCPDSPKYPVCKTMMDLNMKQALINYSDDSKENDQSFIEEQVC